MQTPRPPLAPQLDDSLAKLSRLIRKRAGSKAFTEITVVIQGGNLVRVKENRQVTLDELIPEQW